MLHGVYEDNDVGTIERGRFKTKLDADKFCKLLNDAEETRWEKLKKLHPTLPRAACNFYHVREVK